MRTASHPRSFRPGRSGFEVAVLASPWGPIYLAGRSGRLCAVVLGGSDEALRAHLRRGLGRRRDGRPPTTAGALDDARADDLSSGDVVAEAARQLEAYFAGRRRDFQLPLDLDGLAAWDRRVLEAVRCVPFGTVTSYGRLARAVGAPRAGRAVGGAVGRNPMAIVIPCHRVVSGDGSLGGYGGRWPDEREANLARKRALLTHEGVGLPPPSFFEPPPVAPPWSAGPT